MTVGSIPGMGSIPNLPGSLFFVMTEAMMSDVRTFRTSQDVPSPVQYENTQTSDPSTRGYPPSGLHSVNATRGSFGIDTHGHHYNCTETIRIE
jgi:hypothetical protein